MVDSEGEEIEQAIDVHKQPRLRFPADPAFSIIRSTIDRVVRCQFHIVNAIYLAARAFAQRGFCRRCR